MLLPNGFSSPHGSYRNASCPPHSLFLRLTWLLRTYRVFTTLFWLFNSLLSSHCSNQCPGSSSVLLLPHPPLQLWLSASARILPLYLRILTVARVRQVQFAAIPLALSPSKKILPSTPKRSLNSCFTPFLPSTRVSDSLPPFCPFQVVPVVSAVLYSNFRKV